MSELSERIRRNVHDNMDGWVQRLLIEAADKLDSVTLHLGGGETDDPVELAKSVMHQIAVYERETERQLQAGLDTLTNR